MSRLTILHVTLDSKGGGAETQLDILCRHCDKAKLENITLCVRSDRELHEESRKYIRYERKRKADIGIYYAISDAIRLVKPDVVHAWLPPVVTIPTFLAAWRAKIPVIASFRNAKKFRQTRDIVEYSLSWLLCDGVVSNTPIELCSSWYQCLFRRKLGIVIPNAVDIPITEFKACEQQPVSQDEFKILFAGRITEQKNLKILIRALSELEVEQNWRLSICGAGALESRMRELVASLNLEGKVTWYGFRSDLPSVMAQHHVLVLPSWYEGMPNVLLEAMAIGLPVIVSDIPSHRSVLGSTGAALTFSPDNSTALAERLSRLIGDAPLRDRLRVLGLELVAEYSVDNLVHRYSAYYRDLVRKYGWNRAK